MMKTNLHILTGFGAFDKNTNEKPAAAGYTIISQKNVINDKAENADHLIIGHDLLINSPPH